MKVPALAGFVLFYVVGLFCIAVFPSPYAVLVLAAVFWGSVCILAFLWSRRRWSKGWRREGVGDVKLGLLAGFVGGVPVNLACVIMFPSPVEGWVNAAIVVGAICALAVAWFRRRRNGG